VPPTHGVIHSAHPLSPASAYCLRSTTVSTKRCGTKMNNLGLLDEVEWNDQELAFSSRMKPVERCFMEGPLARRKGEGQDLIRPGAKGRKTAVLRTNGD